MRHRVIKRRKKITRRKAGRILKEGRAKGRKLTKRQKRFFGFIRSGRKKRK